MKAKKKVVVGIHEVVDYTDFANNMIDEGILESNKESVGFLKEDVQEEFNYCTTKTDVHILEHGEKFITVHHWLEKAVNMGDVTIKELLSIISDNVDGDIIQNRFQSLMDEYGYFDEGNK